MVKLILMGLLFAGTMSQQAWEKMKDEDGIKIYTREVAGSDFKEFRGEVYVECMNLQNILDIIMNVEEYDHIIPDCYNPKVLRGEGHTCIVYHLVTKTPWPFKDRDGIYEQTLSILFRDSIARISIKVLPGYLPEIDSYARIQNGVGFWEVRKMKAGRYYVVYQFHSDPDEKVPEWIAKAYIVEDPFTTLQNLRFMIQNNN